MTSFIDELIDELDKEYSSLNLCWGCDDLKCPCQFTYESKSYEDFESKSDEVWEFVDKTKKISQKMIKNKFIKCRTCKQDFIHTIKQQEKYNERGWNEPKTCKNCSNKRYN